MSKPRKVSLNCSRCGATLEAAIFDSIDVNSTPGITADILNGSLFTCTCPYCGFTTRLEYDTEYYDSSHMATMWVTHPNGLNYEQRRQHIIDLMDEYYTIGKFVRIVDDMNRLREKVACLESGRDDRLVELCKLYLSEQLLAQRPDYSLQNVFYTLTDGKPMVFFYDDKGQELSCYLDDGVYNMFSGLYSVAAEKIIPYRVDKEWATVFLQKNKPAQEQYNNNKELSDAGDEFENVKAKESDRMIKPVVKHCHSCGRKLLPDSRFCSFCGVKQDI